MTENAGGTSLGAATLGVVVCLIAAADGTGARPGLLARWRLDGKDGFVTHDAPNQLDETLTPTLHEGAGGFGPNKVGGAVCYSIGSGGATRPSSLHARTRSFHAAESSRRHRWNSIASPASMAWSRRCRTFFARSPGRTPS